MEQVLKLDQDCEEAVNDLLYCKVQQLTVRSGSLIVAQLVEHRANEKVVGSIPREHTTKHSDKTCPLNAQSCTSLS